MSYPVAWLHPAILNQTVPLRRVPRTALGKMRMYAKFYPENPKEMERFEGLGVHRRIIIGTD